MFSELTILKSYLNAFSIITESHIEGLQRTHNFQLYMVAFTGHIYFCKCFFLKHVFSDFTFKSDCFIYSYNYLISFCFSCIKKEIDLANNYLQDQSPIYETYSYKNADFNLLYGIDII